MTWRVVALAVAVLITLGAQLVGPLAVGAEGPGLRVQYIVPVELGFLEKDVAVAQYVDNSFLPR